MNRQHGSEDADHQVGGVAQEAGIKNRAHVRWHVVQKTSVKLIKSARGVGQ